MIISEAFPFRFRGKLASLFVLRNNGFCWGRIVMPDDGPQFDVDTRRDCYDDDDSDAAELMIRKALRGRVSPSVGFPL